MSGPVKPPRVPRQREILWQTLRILRSATTQHLVTVTGRPKNTVQRELRDLKRTGYVRVDDETAGYRDCTWRLVRDSGPKPPLFIKEGGRLTGAVDRNLRQVFGANGGSPPPVGRRANWLNKMLLASPARSAGKASQ